MAIRSIIPSSIFATLFVLAGCNEPIASTSSDPSTDPCGDAGDENCPDNGGNNSNDGNDDNDNVSSGFREYWIPLGERSAEAKRKPWSSWWYPHWQDTLFEGKNNELAPLQKYDAFSGKAAAAYEKQTLYDPRAVSWSGLCDAWAIAAIMEPEPTKIVQHGQLTFRIGDLKALLLKTYEKVPPLTNIGSRNNGEWNDVYADVSPAELHQVIEKELIGKQRAFIIDEDAGPEVWNEPAWKVSTRIERVEGKPEIARVRTWLFLASPHVEDRDFVGTQEDSREYTYDLEGRWQGDRFLVKSGKWTDRSQWDHPDYAAILPERVERGSFNPQIDPTIVDRIVGGRD
jgi:hypothetical protein